MKKLNKLVVGTMMVLGLLIYGNTEAFASNQELYIESGVVSDSHDDYTKAHLAAQLEAILLVDSKGKNDINEYSLGKGFHVLNNFEDEEYRTIIYPIYYQEEIVYTYMVKKSIEGSFSDQLSQAMVPELNELISKHLDETQPVKLFSSGYDIYYVIGNDEPVLLFESPLEAPESISDSAKDVLIDILEESTEVLDISDETEYVLPLPSKLTRGVTSNATHALVDLPIYENQAQVNNGQNSWCMGYALSAIVNAKRGTRALTAETVMRYFFPKATGDAFFNNGGISCPDVVNFTKSQLGMNPYTVNRPLTLAESKNEFNKGNPVFVFAKVIYDSNAKYDYHGLVAHGWFSPTAGQDLYYIWNPWYPNSSIVNGGVKSPTLPFVGGEFKWETSIRNFQ